jgi:hypothetical protein
MTSEAQSPTTNKVDQKSPTKPVGDFTLIVPLTRVPINQGGKSATFYLRDIDEAVFLAVRSMVDMGKVFDAARMMVKTLWVGGDSPEILNTNFIATNAANSLLIELIRPAEGELKKN